MAQLRLFVSMPTGHREWHAEVGTWMVLTNRPAKHYRNIISADMTVLLHELKQLTKVGNKSPEEQSEKSSTKLFSLTVVCNFSYTVCVYIQNIYRILPWNLNIWRLLNY